MKTRAHLMEWICAFYVVDTFYLVYIIVTSCNMSPKIMIVEK